MRKYLFVCFAAFPFFSFTQNWSLFQTGREAYFGFYHPASTVDNPFYDWPVRFDSLADDSGDSLFFNYLVDDLINPYHNDGYCGYSHLDTSWLGNHIRRKASGEFLFINQQQDTMHILSQANISTDWLFLRLSAGDELRATVISISDSVVLGIPDSVKTIELQAYDSIGNAINHPANGWKLQWAKSLGLLKGLQFFQFPDHLLDSEAANDYQPILFGNNAGAGIHHPSLGEIMAYQPGDTIQVETYRNSTSGFYHSFDERTFQSRNFSPNGDSLFFQFRWKRFESFTFNWSVPPTFTFLDIILTDTVTLLTQSWGQIYNTDFNKMNFLPKESDNTMPYTSPLGNSMIFHPLWTTTTEYGGFQKKYDSDWAWFNGDSTCFIYYHIDGSCLNYFTLVGLGQYFHDCGDGMWSDFELPVYIHLGNHVWGTPVDFDSLHVIGIDEHALAGMQLFPNPVSDGVHIQFEDAFPNQYVNLLITDLNGREIFRESLSTSTDHYLPRNTFGAAGIYFYSIQSGESTVHGKWMVE